MGSAPRSRGTRRDSPRGVPEWQLPRGKMHPALGEGESEAGDGRNKGKHGYFQELEVAEVSASVSPFVSRAVESCRALRTVSLVWLLTVL